MEERINPASELYTPYMCCSMWIDHTQRGVSILKDRWNCKYRCLTNSGPNTIWFLWRRELIQHRHSAQHTCASTCRSIILNERRIDTQGSMIWTVPTLMQLLPKHHRISMEERFARAWALSTTYGYSARTIEFPQSVSDTQASPTNKDCSNSWDWRACLL